MENVIKLINDIFSMSFDVVIPVSGSIVAVMTALLLFSIRYSTFRRKVKKYAGQPGQRRLTPRTKTRARRGYAPLEAAKFCDPTVFLFFTDAVADRIRAADPAANRVIDLRFSLEMSSELQSKAPPAETGGNAS